MARPTRQQVAAAAAWTQRDVRRRVVIDPLPDWFPDHCIELGQLHRVVYSSDKYDGRERLWDHRFDEGGGRETEPPLLVDPQSGVMLVVGYGTLYDVTEAGIIIATDSRIGRTGYRSVINPEAERHHVSEE